MMIARVTLWMGQRQMVDRVGAAEPVLPLVDLSGIVNAGRACRGLAEDGLHHRQPAVPRLPAHPRSPRRRVHRMAEEDLQDRGEGLLRVLVPPRSRASERQPARRAGRDQLDLTESSSQRVSSSTSSTNGGVITDAVSTQKWPGEAKVHVSLVNWIKNPNSPPTAFFLDGEPVDGITPELRTPETVHR